MQDQRIYFGNTALKGTQKSGSLKPDGNGYYTVVLGALGVQNSVGETYVNTANARSTFENNSTLMRRITQGLLRGEWGHPDPSAYPNMMMFDRRVRAIKEDRISHHIASVWLEDVEYMGEKVLGIVGKVCPSGPYGDALKKALDNPDENVTFSGRYFSNVNKQGNNIQREIHTVVTWDFVAEAGVKFANKYASPTLESFGEAVFYSHMLQQEAELESRSEAISMESSGGIQARDVLTDFGFLHPSKRPRSMDW